MYTVLTMIFVSTILFVAGLIIGSFLNVIIARYRGDKFLFDVKNLGGRSRCPKCRKTLAWFELVPAVSFIFLRGRCRHCHQLISWQYPLVELLSGLALILPICFYYYFEVVRHGAVGDLLVWYYWLSGAWVVAALLMIVLAAIDWREYLIPDATVIGIAAMGLLVAALKYYYSDLIGWQSSFVSYYGELLTLPVGIFWQHIISGIIGFAFFGAIFALTKGRGMGFGDVKLAGALGLLLGWPDAPLAFAIAFILASIIGVTLLLTGRKKFRQPIPFGPYLVLGTMLVVFFGFSIVDSYFKLLGIF